MRQCMIKAILVSCVSRCLGITLNVSLTDSTSVSLQSMALLQRQDCHGGIGIHCIYVYTTFHDSTRKALVRAFEFTDIFKAKICTAINCLVWFCKPTFFLFWTQKNDMSTSQASLISSTQCHKKNTSPVRKNLCQCCAIQCCQYIMSSWRSTITVTHPYTSKTNQRNHGAKSGQ